MAVGCSITGMRAAGPTSRGACQGPQPASASAGRALPPAALPQRQTLQGCAPTAPSRQAGPRGTPPPAPALPACRSHTVTHHRHHARLPHSPELIRTCTLVACSWSGEAVGTGAPAKSRSRALSRAITEADDTFLGPAPRPAGTALRAPGLVAPPLVVPKRGRAKGAPPSPALPVHVGLHSTLHATLIPC